MPTYKLLIQYDGTDYAGWQIQKNGDTIQQKITEAVEMVLRESVKLIGSGRTDAGVHALGQAAHFTTDSIITPYKFIHSVNSLLPKDISVLQVVEAESNFHSRFGAEKRSYIYLISGNKSPFYYRYSWYVKRPLNIPLLNKFSKEILGSHDFTSFSRRISIKENMVCTVYDAHWREFKGMVLFYIQADRFLHGMVRAIIGTLVKAEYSSAYPGYMREIINMKDRTRAGRAVPAKGLFLYKVNYPGKQI